jgi:hypothetical protein
LRKPASLREGDGRLRFDHCTTDDLGDLIQNRARRADSEPVRVVLDYGQNGTATADAGHFARVVCESGRVDLEPWVERSARESHWSTRRDLPESCPSLTTRMPGSDDGQRQRRRGRGKE